MRPVPSARLEVEIKEESGEDPRLMLLYQTAQNAIVSGLQEQEAEQARKYGPTVVPDDDSPPQPVKRKARSRSASVRTAAPATRRQFHSKGERTDPSPKRTPRSSPSTRAPRTWRPKAQLTPNPETLDVEQNRAEEAASAAEIPTEDITLPLVEPKARARPSSRIRFPVADVRGLPSRTSRDEEAAENIDPSLYMERMPPGETAMWGAAISWRPTAPPPKAPSSGAESSGGSVAAGDQTGKGERDEGMAAKFAMLPLGRQSRHQWFEELEEGRLARIEDETSASASAGPSRRAALTPGPSQAPPPPKPGKGKPWREQGKGKGSKDKGKQKGKGGGGWGRATWWASSASWWQTGWGMTDDATCPSATQIGNGHNDYAWMIFYIDTIMAVLSIAIYVVRRLRVRFLYHRLENGGLSLDAQTNDPTVDPLVDGVVAPSLRLRLGGILGVRHV